MWQRGFKNFELLVAGCHLLGLHLREVRVQGQHPARLIRSAPQLGNPYRRRHPHHPLQNQVHTFNVSSPSKS